MSGPSESEPPLSPHESAIYAALEAPGFVVFEGEHELPPPLGMHAALGELAYKPIPNAPGLGPGDGKRRQSASASARVIQTAKSCLQGFAEKTGLLRSGKWVTNVRPLWSGATPEYDVGKVEWQQGDGPEHQDAAEPSGALRDKPVQHVPLSVIWAIQDGTRLRIRPFDGEWTVINLKKGDVIVFRGDVRHNGVGYIEDNYRIHAYIDSPYIKRNPNRIFNGESADSTTP